MLAASLQSLVAVDPSIVRGKYQAKSKQASCARIVGVSPNRARQCVARSLIVLARQPPDIGLRPRHKLPGAEIVGRSCKRPDAFGSQQARLDGRDDTACDLVLHSENVADLAVVALSPVM